MVGSGANGAAYVVGNAGAAGFAGAGGATEVAKVAAAAGAPDDAGANPELPTALHCAPEREPIPLPSRPKVWVQYVQPFFWKIPMTVMLLSLKIFARWPSEFSHMSMHFLAGSSEGPLNLAIFSPEQKMLHCMSLVTFWRS
jgi:hypothetical protein